MSLSPLIEAPIAVQVHAAAAIAAFVLGLIQLLGAKGTSAHRVIGWVWSALMAIVVVSSFFIHTIRSWGPFSPIHLLSVYTLAVLPLGILQARRHAVDQHRRAMIGLFVGALLIAGALAFMPGRVMHAVLLGTATHTHPK